MRMPEMVAPRVSRFPTAGQGERRLWERDCGPTRFGASYTRNTHYQACTATLVFLQHAVWPEALPLWCAKGFLFAVGEFPQILSGFLLFGYLGAIFPSTFLVVLVVTLPSLWLSRVTHPPGGPRPSRLNSCFFGKCSCVCC